MNFSLKPNKTFYLLLFTVSLSVLITSGFYLYQQQRLRQRNQFLEERHLKNSADLNQCQELRQQLPNLSPTPRPQVFTQRKKGHIHQITANSSFTSVRVVTTDMDTGTEILNEKDVNPYNVLFLNYRGLKFDDIVLARHNDDLYAVIKMPLGMFGSQLYLMQSDIYDAYPQVEALKFFPSDKHSLCGFSLIDYFPQQRQVLLEKGCGGGPAAGGTIKLLSISGQEIDLVSYISGAAATSVEDNDENSTFTTYLAYVQEKLYLAKQEVIDNDWQNARITRIYSLDPFTRVQRYVDVDLTDKNLTASHRPLHDHLHSFEINLYDREAEQYYALDVVEGFLRELNVD